MSSSTFGPAIQSPASRSNGYHNSVGNSMGFTSLFPPKKVSEDEEEKPKSEERMSTPDVSSYLRLTDPDDKFPTLIRRDDNPGLVSLFNTAQDYAVQAAEPF